MAQRIVDVEEVEVISDTTSVSPDTPRRAETTDMATSGIGGNPTPSTPPPLVHITDWEERMLRKLKHFEYDVEIPGIKCSLKRILEMRHEDWTSHPPGNTTSLPTETPKEPIKILLVGLGSVGKSRLGNALEGGRKPVFDSSYKRTEEMKRADFEFEGQKFAVFDTPGYDIQELIENKDAKKMISSHAAIKEGLSETGDGIHAFIFVINATRDKSYETDVKIMEAAVLLNKKTFDHCIIVVTHCSSRYSSRDELLKDFKKNDSIKKFLESIDDRLVMVELGSITTVEKPTSLSQYTYDCEKKQMRKMVLAMIVKSMKDNKERSRKDDEEKSRKDDKEKGMLSRLLKGNNAEAVKNPTLYSRTLMEADLKKSKYEGGCFPSMTMVFTTEGEKVMKQLHLNDSVLVVDRWGQSKYEPVIMFSHAAPDEQSDFVSITTESCKVLRLSPGHLLPIGGMGTLRAAHEVRVGHVVFAVSNGEAVGAVAEKVVAVGLEKLPGLYCPHTPSGSIVVDGIVASCYTDIVPTMVAHGALLPVRVLHHILPSDWFTWLYAHNHTESIMSTLRSVASVWQ